MVDDDESIRGLLARMITALGFAVDTATDSVAALTRLQQSRADIVFVDIRMPGPDGIWLIEQLRASYPETLIIIATGITDLDARVTLAPTVVGYLVKPFDADQVEEILGKAVDALDALPPSEPPLVG